MRCIFQCATKAEMLKEGRFFHAFPFHIMYHSFLCIVGANFIRYWYMKNEALYLFHFPQLQRRGSIIPNAGPSSTYEQRQHSSVPQVQETCEHSSTILSPNAGPSSVGESGSSQVVDTEKSGYPGLSIFENWHEEPKHKKIIF